MKYNGVDADGKPKNFTDADLKEGMVVKLCNEATGMIVVYEGFAVSFFERTAWDCGWSSTASIEHPTDDQLDIVEVYSRPLPWRFFNKTLEQDTLIWKANAELTEQEKRIQELESTIAQAHEQIQQLKGALK